MDRLIIELHFEAKNSRRALKRRHGRMRRIVPSRPSFPAPHFSLFFSVARDLQRGSQRGTNLVNVRLRESFSTSVLNVTLRSMETSLTCF